MQEEEGQANDGLLWKQSRGIFTSAMWSEAFHAWSQSLSCYAGCGYVQFGADCDFAVLTRRLRNDEMASWEQRYPGTLYHRIESCKRWVMQAYSYSEKLITKTAGTQAE